MKIKSLLALFFLLLLTSIAGAQDGGSGAVAYDFTTEGNGEVFIENYPLGPGDDLMIRVLTLDPFEETVRISQDGLLILPIIGEISVAGITIAELREILTEKYSEYYTDFDISIELTAVKRIQIYVFGNTQKPGIYTVYANTTLLDFLQRIGLSINGQNRHLIHHRGDTKTEIDPFKLSILGEMEEQNIYLQFGDRIEIPMSTKSVMLSGKVFRPGIYEALEGETLTDLLSLAGGVDPFSDISDAVIDRPRPDGTFERIHVNLVDIISGKEVFHLYHRDSLYVPPRDTDIYLLGAIAQPGKYPFVEGKNVEQYIAEAGGLDKDAAISFVTIIRPGPRYGNQVAAKYRVDLKDLLKEKWDPEFSSESFNTPHVIIEPGDLIMVPYKGSEDKQRNLSTVLTILNNLFQSILIIRK